MHQYHEKTIKTKNIFSGKIIQLQVDEVELPNGQISTREIVKHPGAVGIIAFTDEGKLLLVDQFRKPLEKGILEIPAGKLEVGEEPLKTAIRELEEETGYACQSMELLHSFYTSPGFADEIIYLYLGKNLIKLENPADTDEDEFLEIVEVTLEEALTLVEQQKIHDAKTLIAVQYMQLVQQK